MQRKQQQLQSKISNFIQSIGSKDAKTIKMHIHALEKQNKQEQSHQHIHQLHASVDRIVPPQKIQRYHELKAKLKQNQETIKIVEKGKAITQSIQLLTNSTNIDQMHSAFNIAITSLDAFEEFSSITQSNINMGTLKEQLYMQILGKLTKAIQGSQQIAQKFKSILSANNLPVKKDEVRKDQLSSKDRHFLAQCLYRQSCLISTKRYVLGLIQQEQDSSDESLLVTYWSESVKRLVYLFISNTQLRNLQQPSWMFDYMQQILNSNYKFILQLVCKKDLKHEISSGITRHFLSYSYSCLLLQVNKMRFQKDLPNLNDFLIFNFIDQLAKLQQKLALSFNLRPSLVQSLILQFDPSHQILSKALEHEYKWFQTKIFEDFINIDYSRVNLKNLDAYNIVSSFLSLFERLYSKYTSIRSGKAKDKIQQFYCKLIMNLVAHVKTSFDRIYNHSKLPKIDVLLSFKRIQNQLRTVLAQFIARCPHLQQELQTQYYTFLSQGSHTHAYISLGDIMSYLSIPQQNDHSKYLSAFTKIFEEWQTKMELILKFAPFSDNKVRAIFFKYLQATTFSSVGLNLYLKIFEPYLRILFSQDRHRVLISMITMSQQAFKEYMQSHTKFLQFLSAQQKKQLTSFKRSIVSD